MKALIKIDIPEAYIKEHGNSHKTFDEIHNLVKEYLDKEVFNTNENLGDLYMKYAEDRYNTYEKKPSNSPKTYNIKKLLEIYPIEGGINLIDLCNFATPRFATLLYNITNLYTTYPARIKQTIEISNLKQSRQQLILDFCNKVLSYSQINESNFRTLLDTFAKVERMGWAGIIVKNHYVEFMGLFIKFVEEICVCRRRLDYNNIDLSTINLDDININCVNYMSAELREMLVENHKEHVITVDDKFYLSDFLKNELLKKLKDVVSKYRNVEYYTNRDNILPYVIINGSLVNTENKEIDVVTIVKCAKLIDNYVKVILPRLRGSKGDVGKLTDLYISRIIY